MLNLLDLKENEIAYAAASTYYDEYYSRLRSFGYKPSFTFSEVEYFTVDNREDGLTETVFYDKNKKILFSYLD
jgi:hypothetical protein